MSTHQVSKPLSTNQSIAEEKGRPGTCRSKVGCPAIEEPCTNRIVPFGFCEGDFCQRKRRTSPFWVQCSLPVIALIYNGFCARIHPLPEEDARNGCGQSHAGYFSQAAHAPRRGARRAPCHPREGPRHLADLDLASLRRGSARACLRP